jgi:hypothetical protein
MAGLALPETRGIAPATLNAQPIREIQVAPDFLLNDMTDVHFGINIKSVVHPDLYDGFEPLTDARDAALLLWGGLGPRVIEMKRRHGRAAEHDFVSFVTMLGKSGLDETKVEDFNKKIAVAKPDYPADAQFNNSPVTGNKGYLGATKDTAIDTQGGLRWSKTALEYTIASGVGRVHFHLTGMGELSGILDKKGGYGFNVTSRELRYLWRWWMRFQDKVTFYNGYTAAEKAVEGFPPWVPLWEPDSATCKCRICNQKFSRVNPVRWRHHCRLCGKVVCDDCSKHKIRLKFPVTRPGALMESGLVRVCEKCHRPTAPSDFT